MGKEIERKFLLSEGASIPIPAKFQKFKIKQGYIQAEKGKQVRIRITSDKAVLCVKFTSEFIRDEFEYEIPMSDAKEIYSKLDWKLEKKRLSFKRGKENYDVDTFPNGIVWVEVEFNSIEEMNKWVKPSWLGKEISNVSKYSNIAFAKSNLTF
jgi:CYTH domain-containing protein